MAKTTTPAQRHAEFKENAARVIHTWAEPKGWCSDFDRILEGVGLPGRAWHRNGSVAGGRWVFMPDGEETEEQFEAWRVATSAELIRQAKRHGIQGYIEPLREAGFDTPTEHQVVINGEFTIYQTVEVVEGEDVITGVNVDELRNAVYYRFRDDNDTVTWKATIDEEGHEPTWASA